MKKGVLCLLSVIIMVVCLITPGCRASYAEKPTTIAAPPPQTVQADKAPAAASIPETVQADKVPVTASIPETVEADKVPAAASIPETVQADKVPEAASIPETVQADKVPEAASIPETVEADKVPEAASIPETVQAEEVECSSAEIFFPYSSNTTNAIIAINYLNGAIIEPGQEFSYNQVVGKRTKARGFIVGHDINSNPCVGGGVCRLATIVFQAAKNGNFTIVERHPHSKPVTYAKRGMDATVYYGYADLRFLNNSTYPIKIYASSTSQQTGALLKVRIVSLVNN